MILNINQVREIVARCHFPGFEWVIVGDFAHDNGPTYLQGRFMAPCTVAGDMQPQYTRQWMLTPTMIVGQLVRTAFKCALTAVEHEAREQFTYRGHTIFGPHLDVEQLVHMRRVALGEAQ